MWQMTAHSIVMNESVNQTHQYLMGMRRTMLVTFNNKVKPFSVRHHVTPGPIVTIWSQDKEIKVNDWRQFFIIKLRCDKFVYSSLTIFCFFCKTKIKVKEKKRKRKTKCLNIFYFNFLVVSICLFIEIFSIIILNLIRYCDMKNLKNKPKQQSNFSNF